LLLECARVRLSARLSVRRGAVCGAAGAAHRSRNESGHPGRQCRRLPMCPSRRAGHAPTRRQSSPGKEARSQGTLTRGRSAVASSRAHPVASRRRLFAVGQQPADGVCPRRRGRCVAVAFIVRSSSRVPGLAQQGDDLALAPLPCEVEGRLAKRAGIGSKRRIGACFEEALGDREVAVGCRPMQCCPNVDVLKTNERPNGMTTWKRIHRMCWGRACSRLTLALTSIASASRRRRTHPSCPLHEALIKAVVPLCGKRCTRGVIECQSTRGAWASTRGCGARHATRTRVPSSAGRRGGGAVQRAVGTRRRLGRARRRKQQRRRGRGRPREAHAAAHFIRIVPVDVPSKADQPRELRLFAVLSGLEHGLAHRVAHRVRRALQAFARSDTCAFGGVRAAPL
jgi:hypothetical protein